jgi:adapter protein MecA 1/2
VIILEIEKLSDTQVKFILNESDLIERNIKMSELAYGSDKTQGLFREMLEKALVECDFDVDNVPLMIEAIPMTSNSIVIIVTKVSNHNEIEDKFNLIPDSKEKNKFKSNGFVEQDQHDANSNLSVFSFSSLDDVSNCCKRLYGNFVGIDILFKKKDVFILYLEASSKSVNIKNIDLLLCEYGYKHVANNISLNYLYEHCEVLIKENAIDIFTKYKL